jgi:hypothetical protein
VFGAVAQREHPSVEIDGGVRERSQACRNRDRGRDFDRFLRRVLDRCQQEARVGIGATDIGRDISRLKPSSKLYAEPFDHRRQAGGLLVVGLAFKKQILEADLRHGARRIVGGDQMVNLIEMLLRGVFNGGATRSNQRLKRVGAGVGLARPRRGLPVWIV